MRRRIAFGLAASGGALLAALATWRAPWTEPVSTGAAPPAAAWVEQAAAAPAVRPVPAGPAGATADAGAAAAAAFEARLRQSSLAGTEPDGDWGHVDGAGTWHPTPGLRRRFDHYLSLQGELPLEAIAAGVAALAEAELGTPSQARVMATWADYLAVESHAWTRQADPRRPESFEPALDERRRVRRERLGLETAEAFYREEEAALERVIARVNAGGRGPAAAADGVGAASWAAGPATAVDAPRADLAGQPSPTTVTSPELGNGHTAPVDAAGAVLDGHPGAVLDGRPGAAPLDAAGAAIDDRPGASPPAAPLHPDATRRLAQLDAAEAAWRGRLEEARLELQRLRSAPQLSEPQRAEAMDALVTGRFGHGGEALRARVLLGMGGG